MFKTQIGSFNVDGVFMESQNPQPLYDDPLTAVTIWTDAPVNSPYAKKFMREICEGKHGIGEIIGIQVFDSKILLEMTDDVTTEAQAKQAANSFLHALCSIINQFDEFDIYRWKSSVTEYFNEVSKGVIANIMAGVEAGYSSDTGYL